MESLPQQPREKLKQKLTDQDLQDREDFQYLLSIMEKQRNIWGKIQQLDIDDATLYRDKLKSFAEGKAPEGPITVLFNDIIFDFDGVLYDSTYSTYRALQLTLEEKADKNISAPDTIPEIANSYQAPFEDYYRRFGIPVPKTEKEWEIFRDEYRQKQKQVDSEHHTPAALYPEVKEVLDKMKEAKRENPDLRVHIISAGSDKHIKDVLQKNRIQDDFDEIHAECHDKSAMIKTIADKAEVREKTIMIGDLPSDIKDAQRVEGVKTIAVARGAEE